MECYRRAMRPGDQALEVWKETLSQANKLSRTYATLLEALNRRRRMNSPRRSSVSSPIPNFCSRRRRAAGISSATGLHCAGRFKRYCPIVSHRAPKSRRLRRPHPACPILIKDRHTAISNLSAFIERHTAPCRADRSDRHSATQDRGCDGALRRPRPQDRNHQHRASRLRRGCPQKQKR